MNVNTILGYHSQSLIDAVHLQLSAVFDSTSVIQYAQTINATLL